MTENVMLSFAELVYNIWLQRSCLQLQIKEELQVSFLCSWIKLNWIEYTQIIPWRPMTLLMTTMCPERLFFMSGITSLIMRTTPKKLVSNTLFISSMLMLSTGPSKPTPALLTDRKTHKHTDDTHCLYLQHCNSVGLIWTDICIVWTVFSTRIDAPLMDDRWHYLLLPPDVSVWQQHRGVT